MNPSTPAQCLIMIKCTVDHLYGAVINPDASAGIGCFVIIKQAVNSSKCIRRTAINTAALIGRIVDKLTIDHVRITVGVITRKTSASPFGVIINKYAVFKNRIAIAVIVHTGT